MPSTTLSTLPNELLGTCISYLSSTSTACLASSPDIQNLRLVSRRLHAVSSPFLITKAYVSFTSESFRELEELANHHVYSKGVKKVKIDVSYFDKYLADDLRHFVENAATVLSQYLERLERSRGFPTRKKRSKKKFKYQYLSEAYPIPDQWSRVSAEDFKRDKATKKQQLVLDAYKKYVKLFEDQESVNHSGDGIVRLVRALEKFTALEKIVVQDKRRCKPSQQTRLSYAVQLSDVELAKRCLQSSQWKGTFQSAMLTSPPIHLVSGLFTALADTRIRPRQFVIKLTAPTNMRCMDLSSNQLQAVRKTLERAERLDFYMQGWARKGSYAENNDRSRGELAGFGAFAKACFSSSTLQNLTVNLYNYPCFHEFPQISISDLLDLSDDIAKSHLTSIKFINVPFKVGEMLELVNTFKLTLKSFEGSELYLLDGNWEDSIEILRGLENLHHLELQYPRGGEFGDRYVRNLPIEQMKDYIMRLGIERNPLEIWQEDRE
ncbi:hypothetical protein K504DRAFT_381406 [Pleomassaria siparia CBS 279.74]|uniref:F-box domain-containing protein n=1 Tax=Pleomassaria siparia CBS 279.74 TaxID=1314801 RepID=A0A6G1K6H0_9PLEO|nr:hypothetical protein K504DRAFT_381406 [Pleomassaria siparia CBS 279.74]